MLQFSWTYLETVVGILGATLGNADWRQFNLIKDHRLKQIHEGCYLIEAKWRVYIIIGSDNGLLPGWCQAIIWTNAGILLIQSLGTNFSEILI